MSTNKAASPVLIIGGGAAGLSTAAALARRGLRVTVLERDEYIGGSWSRRYQSLKLHTIRSFSGLAYYPIPGDRPRYLSKDEYATYLQEYAAVLGLDVSLGERVEAVQPKAGSLEGKGWDVLTSHGTRQAKVVVVATGHYAEAKMPALAGIEGFPGVVIHSSQYTTGAVYQGRKALVIGLGNSGAEIAADLAVHGASSVSVSVRTTPPIVTREMFKSVPVQLLGIALTPLGMPRALDRIGAALRRVSVGDLSAYGLGPAAWGPFTARRPAVIDAGFLKALKQGRISVRPTVDRFDAEEVVYADGYRDTVDVVVAATGFRTGLERILKVPGVLDDVGQPESRAGDRASASGLFFVGFEETLRGHLFEIERESKQLAAEIGHYLSQSGGR